MRTIYLINLHDQHPRLFSHLLSLFVISTCLLFWSTSTIASQLEAGLYNFSFNATVTNYVDNAVVSTMKSSTDADNGNYVMEITDQYGRKQTKKNLEMGRINDAYPLILRLLSIAQPPC